MTLRKWSTIEQQPGPPLVTPVNPTDIDAHRRATYESYEKFLRAQLEELHQHRDKQWQRNYADHTAYRRSVRPMRNRLKAMLGHWVEPKHRPPVEIKDQETLLATSDYEVRRFRFDIFPGLSTYAIEMIPNATGRRPGLLIQHGYAGTPENACGLTPSANLGEYSYRSLGIRAVQRGFHVIAVHHPSGHGRDDELIGSIPNHEHLGNNYGKNRLHRLAQLAGSTLFGIDMMASSRGIDFLNQHQSVDAKRIGMYGKSQGGQSALYLPALDQRIQASICCAYFNSRYQKLIGPHRATCYLDSAEEDKFFSDVISCFSDADLVSLIAPRAFAVEAGEQDTSVDFEKSDQEFPHAQHHYEKLGIPERIEFIAHREGHISATGRALDFLEEQLQR